MPCCMCSPCHGKKTGSEKATTKKNTLVVERYLELNLPHSLLWWRGFQTLLVGAVKFMVNESFRMVQADALSRPWQIWQQEAELWTLQAQVDHLGFHEVAVQPVQAALSGAAFF